MKIDNYSQKFIHYYTEGIPCLIEEIFKNNQINSFMDLGAGDGALLYALNKKGYLDHPRKVIATDVSIDRVNNIRLINDRIRCFVADANSLNMVKDKSLDLVVSSQVIEHLQNQDEFLSRINRIIKDSGTVYLSTVFRKWYGWYFYRCNGRWALDPTHLREYGKESELLDIVNKYNFKVVRNKKTLQWFAVLDFFLKRIIKKRDIYGNKFFKALRYIKIPVPGYYNWELVLKKI